MGSLQPCAARLVHSAESPVSMLYVDSRESCCMRVSPERAASKGARARECELCMRVACWLLCLVKVGLKLK